MIKAIFEQISYEKTLEEAEVVIEEPEMLFQIDEEKDLNEDLKKEEISANSESTDDVQENPSAPINFKI